MERAYLKNMYRQGVPIRDKYCDRNLMFLQMVHILVNSGPLKQVQYKGKTFILPHLNIKFTNLSILKVHVWCNGIYVTESHRHMDIF